MKVKPWKPIRPTSRGATAYHNAVVNASWHMDNIKGLLDIVDKKIKTDDIVVDFGAGTGGSAVYFLDHIQRPFTLWLVDNSPSWLGKAYEILSSNTNVTFSLLGKVDNRYSLLHEVIGEKVADHVVSANTFHLVPPLKEAFSGIFRALKRGGTFTFQSGNILYDKRKEGLLMIDDTVKQIHDISLTLIQSEKKFTKYKKGLSNRLEKEHMQRKLIFPDPRPVDQYVKRLESAGFSNISVSFKKVKVTYKDWLAFLRVKRLQAGILPEIGGKEATPQEERDRDQIITQAAKQLFKQMEKSNPFADKKSFTAEWIYLTAKK